MDIDAFRNAVAHAGIVAVTASFLAGLVFSFNPVAMAAIPVSLAYVTKARTSRQAFVFAAMFILGMVVIHVALGLVAGFGGLGVQKLLDRQWGVLIGPVLIVLGLMWPGWIRVPLPTFSFKAKRPNSSVGAFLLGIPFSVAVCPVCTPALAVLLGVVTSLGSPLLGVVLLLAFAVGRAVPLAIGAWSLGWLENLRFVSAYRRVFEILGGLTLVAAGLYMLNAYFFWIPQLAS